LGTRGKERNVPGLRRPMERTEKRVKRDGRVPLIYDSTREKSEALLSITVDASGTLWVALGFTTSTLLSTLVHGPTLEAK